MVNNNFVNGFICTIVIIASAIVMQSSAADNLLTCDETSGPIDFNVTKFAGVWYEISRSDFDSTFEKNASCVEYHFEPGKVDITLRRNKDKKLQKRETLSGQFRATMENLGVFHLILKGYDKINVVILDTDYANYTIACAYANTKSSGAFVLSRKPTLDEKYKEKIEPYKSVEGFNKLESTLQDPKQCNGAGSLLPIFSLVIVSIFLGIKF